MNTNQGNADGSDLYAGIVWIASAVALITYGVMTVLNASLPGVEELIRFLSSIDERYLYFAALASIFIEGLYFIGSFFPGSSLVIVLAILSQVGGAGVFVTTILLIFVGWCAAGAVNIFLATLYRRKIVRLHDVEWYDVKDHLFGTWFPSFRASHEVAQIVAGAKPLKVFLSSLRVRVWASLFMGVVTLIVPLFYNVREASDREGYATIVIVAAISLYVGVRKVQDHWRSVQ